MLTPARRVSLHAWIVAPALLAACQEPPPPSGKSPVEIQIPSSQEPPIPASSTPAAPPDRTARKQPPPPPIARPRAIGDVTCAKTADCTLTTREECCDCCPAEPAAASRAWLAWRDRTLCPQTPCAPCAGAPCAGVADAKAFRAVCEDEQCTLVRAAQDPRGGP